MTTKRQSETKQMLSLSKRESIFEMHPLEVKEKGSDPLSAINRWLINISKSVVKLWNEMGNDWNSARDFICSHTIEQPLSPSFSLPFLLLISKYNIILMPH